MDLCSFIEHRQKHHLSTTHFCLRCHRSNINLDTNGNGYNGNVITATTFITCPSCSMARYCSVKCMEEDRASHLRTCESIASSIESCNEAGVIRNHERASLMSMSQWKDHLRHWHRLTSLLFIETVRPSELDADANANISANTNERDNRVILNHTSLDLLTHILLRILLPLKIAPYTALCAILLPKALMLRDDLNPCHDLLSATSLDKLSLLYQDWEWDYGDGDSAFRAKTNCRDRHECDDDDARTSGSTRIDAPVQSLLYRSDGNVDALLLMDLILVRYELHTRVISMKGLKHSWMKSIMVLGMDIVGGGSSGSNSTNNSMGGDDDNCRIEKIQNTIETILHVVGSYLGAPRHWNAIHPPIVERQCLDLIKLLATRTDPQLIPSLLRRYDLAKRHSLPLLDSNCVTRGASSLTMVSFHRCLALLQLRRYEHACEFIRDTISHMIPL